jgi:hypothetical protein
VISAVSGGSVGAMYFANAYGKYGAEEGELPDNDALERTVKMAERSSLDSVAWALVYSDFLRSVAPFLYKTGFFRRTDRGSALENEWRRDIDPEAGGKGELSTKLGDWKRDAIAGKRPGVVFNATLVGSGRPLLFSTIDRDENLSVAWTFDELYEGYDAPVTSAVRMSATFPYVTPAARAHRYKENDWRKAEFHVVDGGYYDNYGMAALVECLDNELDKLDELHKSELKDLTELMVIRIHSMPVMKSSGKSPDKSPDRIPEDDRGFLFQMGAPLFALDKVRGAGQLSHGKVEFDLLQKRWRERAGHKVNIELATFEYPGKDAPLSWHLTDKQKQAIETAWKENYVDNKEPDLGNVKRFLAR